MKPFEQARVDQALLKALAFLKLQLVATTTHSDLLSIELSDRSALINLEEIVEVQPWFNQTVLLIMSNHLKIPVGRSYQAQLNQRLGL